jgi:hypothetical protein
MWKGDQMPGQKATLHSPRLWPFLPTLVATFLFAMACAYLLFQGLAAMPGQHIAGAFPAYRVRPTALADLVKTTVTAATLLAGVFAVVYAYRKQRVEEAAGHRADSAQFYERYAAAAAQLGSEAAVVRLAGVYALARLAEDWSDQRQTCVDVLCAYLRLPNLGANSTDLEVRRTVVRVLRDHMRSRDDPATWSRCSLDFTGATLEDADFSDAIFMGNVKFVRTEFLGSTLFSRAHFVSGDCSFSNASFASGSVYFTEAVFEGASVWFLRTQFSGARVSFEKATFAAPVAFFRRARFSGSSVSFVGATVHEKTIRFDGAKHSSGEILWGDLKPLPRTAVDDENSEAY